jgi:hypothetical protein
MPGPAAAEHRGHRAECLIYDTALRGRLHVGDMLLHGLLVHTVSTQQADEILPVLCFSAVIGRTAPIGRLIDERCTDGKFSVPMFPDSDFFSGLNQPLSLFVKVSSTVSA